MSVINSVFICCCRHAGVLFGITNTVGTIPGFVAPTIASLLTPNVSYFYLHAFAVKKKDINKYSAIVYMKNIYSGAACMLCLEKTPSYIFFYMSQSRNADERELNICLVLM